MINLYAIFHANLSFSLIEETEYPKVIEQCYWPLLKIAENYPQIKIGLELSGNTLLKITDLDPIFIERLNILVKQKKIEIIASGFEQIITPLVPKEITIENLRVGQKIYQTILSITPKIAYINEQTFSDGLIDIYKDFGFEVIVIDWDNLPEESKKISPPYQPTVLRSQRGKEIVGVFISFTAMQQFRKLVFNHINFKQYLFYLKQAIKESSVLYFPIYGDDIEIYDFKPGSLNFNLKQNKHIEFKKIEEILSNLSKLGFKFTLPSEVSKNRLNNPLAITDSSMTIRTKKQEKYNVTRWAVCGRTNSKSNTSCYKLRQTIKQLENLRPYLKTNQEDIKRIEILKKILLSFFSSDLRTHTTESKWGEFNNQISWAMEESKLLLEQTILKKENWNIFLINPNKEVWNGKTFVIKVYFKPKQMYGRIGVKIKGREVASQQEEVTIFQDGSIQSAVLVFKPYLKPLEKIQLKFFSKDKKYSYSYKKIKKIKTKSVFLNFWARKGAVIESLIFPKISKKPLAGTLLQGFYSKPKLSADWFTAHTIIYTKDGNTLTDLEDIEVYAPRDIENYPIRIPIFGKTKIGPGEVIKKYFVYINEPRVDIEKTFMFYNLEPKSFRNFNLTLLPKSFDLDSLYLSTTNGGDIEKFLLKGSEIIQDEAVNLKVSSHGCQGATEGWVCIGDKDKGIAIINNLTENYSVPLIHFEESDQEFLGRISTTVAESDETATHFFRGKLNFKTTILGIKYPDEASKESYFINNSLLTAFSMAEKGASSLT